MKERSISREEVPLFFLDPLLIPANPMSASQSATAPPGFGMRCWKEKAVGNRCSRLRARDCAESVRKSAAAAGNKRCDGFSGEVIVIQEAVRIMGISPHQLGNPEINHIVAVKVFDAAHNLRAGAARCSACASSSHGIVIGGISRRRFQLKGIRAGLRCDFTRNWFPVLPDQEK